MKALRIIGIVFISIFLVVVTCLFTYSFAFKEVVKGVASDIIDFGNITKEINTEEIEVDPKLKEILKGKDVQDFMDKYIDITLEGFSGADVGDVDLSGDLLELIEAHKDELKEAGFEIDDEELADFKNSDEYNELNEKYSNMFDEIKEETNNSEMMFIRTFSFMGTNNFRMVCLVLIIVSVLLIGLLSWSLYKWMLPIGIDAIIGGVLTLTGGILFSMLSTAILKSYTIKTISLFGFGFGLMLLGIILIIVYAVIKSKEKKNAVS